MFFPHNEANCGQTVLHKYNELCSKLELGNTAKAFNPDKSLWNKNVKQIFRFLSITSEADCAARQGPRAQSHKDASSVTDGRAPTEPRSPHHGVSLVPHVETETSSEQFSNNQPAMEPSTFLSVHQGELKDKGGSQNISLRLFSVYCILYTVNWKTVMGIIYESNSF